MLVRAAYTRRRVRPTARTRAVSFAAALRAELQRAGYRACQPGVVCLQPNRSACSTGTRAVSCKKIQSLARLCTRPCKGVRNLQNSRAASLRTGRVIPARRRQQSVPGAASAPPAPARGSHGGTVAGSGRPTRLLPASGDPIRGHNRGRHACRGPWTSRGPHAGSGDVRSASQSGHSADHLARQRAERRGRKPSALARRGSVRNRLEARDRSAPPREARPSDPPGRPARASDLDIATGAAGGACAAHLAAQAARPLVTEIPRPGQPALTHSPGYRRRGSRGCPLGHPLHPTGCRKA